MPAHERDVVVVEDDRGMREAMTRVLDAVGFRASPFPSAEALLEASGAAAADCFVFDVHLPGLSGFELFRRLGAAASNTPTIFITGHDDAASRSEAESLKGAAYLRKPFTGRQLIQAVQDAFDAHATVGVSP